MRGKVYKVKKGKEEEWKNWGERLMSYWLNEAVDSLKEENIFAEFFYMFTIGDTTYTLGGDIPLGERNTPNIDRALNHLHKEKKRECLEPACDADIVYMIKRTP